LGLLLGERGFLDRRVRDAVIRLGIAHLLALSGMHLGVVALLAIALARAAPRGREVLVLAALTLYVGVVGDVASLSRAYLMAALLLLARLLARPARPVDALGKALFIMLLVSPVSIRSVGLQLSFAATLAVLLVVGRFAWLRNPSRPGAGVVRRVSRRVVTGMAGAVVISLAVELVIAPLQFHHFGRVSLVGPLATALFVLPVTLVQVLAMLGAALGGLPLVGDGALACLTLASRATTAGILAAARVAPDPLVWAGPRVVLYYAGLALVWYFPGRRRAWLGAALLMAGALAWR
jgi:competence protein ComEC